MPANGGGCPGDHSICQNIVYFPPPATPPLSSFSEVTLQGATLSTVYAGGHPAAHAIDGDVHTNAVSRKYADNWLAVEVPIGTAIEYVAVYNRVDLAGSWPAQLGTFEVWVGSMPGDTSPATAVKCGEARYRNPSGIDSEPYVINCGGVSSGQFVTIKQIGPSRFLILAEVDVYS